ncbi:MAG: outer membrane lipoprotein-sorting protein [Planctomycetes bacterium]|nr:outer membrane lipoprotein-sorting protein [Planctomycetota bacterium]
MNTFSLLRYLVISFLVAAIPMVASGSTTLTFEQLVLLMDASAERYKTMDIEMVAEGWQYDIDNKTKLKLKIKEEVLWRWAKSKSFCRVIRTDYVNSIDQPEFVTIETNVVSPKLCKRLKGALDGRIPRGYIYPGKYSDALSERRSMYRLMWNTWDSRDSTGETAVNYDEKNNYYIAIAKFSSREKSGKVKLYIDPSKDFIPVKKEYILHDGRVLMRYELDDFHQTKSGLWIPYRIFDILPLRHYRGIIKVLNVKVNEPIADDLFDFEFPVGTIVYDEILNLRYKIEDVNRPQSPVVDPCSEVTGTAVGTLPVKEEALAAAASKARELIAAHASTDTISSGIEVSPLTVMVTPNKYEYKLSVKGYGDTKPVLLNYKIESAELKLSAFKNLIDNDDRLVVNVNRLQSHTGFASGRLFLYFAGESNPVEITFVSAPLANAP